MTEIEQARKLPDGSIAWDCGCSTRMEGVAFIFVACPNCDCPVAKQIIAMMMEKKKPMHVIYKKADVQ